MTPRREVNRLLVIVGPTGSGKSALALDLAQRIDAEIVSADSRQVYRYMDIGTAKPSLADRTEVPHHLLDLVTPDEQFDAASFRSLALSAIDGIAKRGRRIIVCGGTGLYLRVLLRGLFPGPAADRNLRRRLMGIECKQGKGALWRQLAEKDPRAAARLHANDLMRIVRALEVFEITGRTMTSWQEEHGFCDSRFNYLMIGLNRGRGELYSLIERRCRAMLDAGLIEEIAALYERGYGHELRALQSLGYREMGSYLRGDIDFDAAFALFVRGTKRFAKRQITWFRKEPGLWWVHPEQERREVIETAKRFLETGCRPPILSLRSP